MASAPTTRVVLWKITGFMNRANEFIFSSVLSFEKTIESDKEKKNLFQDQLLKLLGACEELIVKMQKTANRASKP